MPTLLAVFAHPDDEAFGSGGTLARAARDGHRAIIVCATRGESGKITDETLGDVHDVGALRERELEDACRALGIEPPRFLDYHDSGRGDRLRKDDPRALVNADEAALERDVLGVIEEVRPDVILTFDPKGIYGHPDHIVIQRAATAAFWSAGGRVQPAPRRLLYNVMPAARMREFQAARPKSPLANLDAGVYGVSDDTIAVRTDVGDVMDLKLAAVRAHRSQVGPASSFAGLQDDDWQRMLRTETFALAGVRGTPPRIPSDDPFDGLGDA